MWCANILITVAKNYWTLIKVKELKSYDEVLNDPGQRRWLRIMQATCCIHSCKLWNEMILKKGNDTAQDSNDRYLANIQKGGTYSVVPRIPGGEITPEKLIVIGQCC
jgi:nitrite reductase (NADH) large subunit